MHTDISAQNRKIIWGIIFTGIVLILFLAGSGPPNAHAQEAGTPQPDTDNTLTTPVETPQPGKHEADNSIVETPQPGKGYADPIRLSDGTNLVRRTINGPLVPPPGLEAERQVVELPKAKSDTKNAIGIGGSQWVLGCSPGAASDIAAELDQDGTYPNIWIQPETIYPTPPVGDHYGYWEDDYGDEYPSHPLVATQKGVAGRTTNGTIEYVWVGYDSTAPDPSIAAGWEPLVPQSIGDYMFTSQSAYGNVDGATSYWFKSSGAPATWEELEIAGVPDGTLGLKRFYESRGYAVSEAYNQRTDNKVSGGFSYVQFKAEIDAGRPVLLGLDGHTIVGIGYDTSSNLVYLHNGWDYDTHTMVWGGSYEGMELMDVSIVKLAPPPPIRSAGTYDDSDSSMVYSGIWNTYTDTGPYDGSIQYSTKIGNFAAFTIQGQQFKLLYTGASNRGNLDVYVDDVKVGTVNEYNTSMNWQSEWTSPELSTGTHLVRLVHTSGAVVDVDAVQVYSTPIPPPGPGTYDDTDAAWTYSGSWSAYSGAGPYNNSLHYTSTVGNYAEITFTGTQFMLTYLQNTNRGLLDVYVDGVKVNTINANGTTIWQKTWTSATYSLGEHTVRFVHAGGGTYVDVDAIEILGPDTTAPAAISDLNAVTGVAGGSVDLSWTAVGDDGSTGTASSYLVRYSTSAINNDTDWNNATAFANTLTPKAAGGAESLTVTGLTPGTTYFFAVRAQDEKPNLGGLSNSPSATAKIPPPPVGAGTYDDTNTAWRYSGAWSTYSGTGPYNNTLHYTSTPGSQAEITFTGIQFKLKYLQNTNRGLIDVYVDGVKVDTINAYGPTIWQKTWTSASYALGEHTVRFVHAGGGTYVDVDAIEILGPDTTAPASIDDLQAVAASCGGGVNLSWTAVGDDGNNGTASAYLVRYSTSAINNDTDWNNATAFANSLTPKAAGGAESLAVTGLTPGTTYFFAVRAQDEKPNLGGLSNSPSAQSSGATVVNPGVFDDTHSAWCYDGPWNTYSGSGPFNNSMHYTSTPGSQAEITFTGTQFTLKYTQYTNRGLLDVYVDGVKVNTINQYGPTTWQKSWTSATYSLGEHTVRFVHAGGGTYVDVDAIEILGPDTTAPAPIDDLQAVAASCGGGVNLSWTAVGDDGTNGMASAYLVRYSTSSINNDTDWNNATVFTNSLTPKAAGGAESLAVTGLTPGTTYFFAVRAQDEKPNLGGLSNSPSAQSSGATVVNPGAYDDTHSAWCYDGPWNTYSGSGPFNNTMHYTSTPGSQAEITFTGTQFTLKYTQYTNRGLLDVYVDGVKVNTINQYGPTTWQKNWTSAAYSLGEHTVRFVHAGGGTYVDIDAIEILGPDTTAPAAISDLNAVTGAAGGSVDLSWTAVGDDGGTGTTSSYLVRYSTSAINNDTDWNNATVFANTLTPKAAGGAESLTVTGLTPGTTYFFAVRAQDEIPNLGGLSNSPSAAAKVPPPPVGAGTYDDTDVAWTYSGVWSAYNGAGPYNNTLHYTSTVGDYAEITFTGSKFSLTYLQNTNRGSLDVYLDGVKVDTINANGTTAWQKTWTSASYPNGDHTVRFVHAGGGTYVDIDAITVVQTEDNYEENDSLASAYDLSSQKGVWLSNINGYGIQADDDWYRIYVASGYERVLVSALFTHSEGDIDIGLYNSAGTQVAYSYTVTDNEHIAFTVPTGGAYYYIRVYYADQGNQYNLSWDSIQPPTPIGAGTYDDTHSAWTYSTDWTSWTGSGPYNNTMHYTNTPGGYAELTFSGTGFILTYTQNTNRGSIDVYIDSSYAGTIDAYGTLNWQSKVMSPTLSNGTHTVKFDNYSFGGAYIDIDAIEILP